MDRTDRADEPIQAKDWGDDGGVEQPEGASEPEPPLLLRISLDLSDEAWSVVLFRKVVRNVIGALWADEARASEIERAVGEAVDLAAAHTAPPAGPPHVAVDFFVDRVCVQVVDPGDGLIRADAPDPQEAQRHARELGLLERIADSVTVRALEGGGCLLEATFVLPHATADERSSSLSGQLESLAAGSSPLERSPSSPTGWGSL